MAVESIVPVASGIKYALDLVKTVKDAKVQIPLQGAILSAQEQMIKLQGENSNLKRENDELKSIKEWEGREERRQEGGYLTFKSDESRTKYCTCCWDVRRLRVQMGEKDGYYYCFNPECTKIPWR